MPPREFNNHYPDSLITVEYDGSLRGTPFHDASPGILPGAGDEADDILSDGDEAPGFQPTMQQTVGVDHLGSLSSDEDTATGVAVNVVTQRATVSTSNSLISNDGVMTFAAWHGHHSTVSTSHQTSDRVRSETIVDPLSVDITHPEQDNWDFRHPAALSSVEKSRISLHENNVPDLTQRRGCTSPIDHLNPLFDRHVRTVSSGSTSSVESGQVIPRLTSLDHHSLIVSQRLHSSHAHLGLSHQIPRLVIDSHVNDVRGIHNSTNFTATLQFGKEGSHNCGIPELDSTQESSMNASHDYDDSDFSPIDSPPRRRHQSLLVGNHGLIGTCPSEPITPNTVFLTDSPKSQDHIINGTSALSPVRFGTRRPTENILPVTYPSAGIHFPDESMSTSALSNTMSRNQILSNHHHRHASDVSLTSNLSSNRALQWNTAFELDSNSSGSPTSSPYFKGIEENEYRRYAPPLFQNNLSNETSDTSPCLNMCFGPNTVMSDLKYYAERGLIVALLQSLHTPRLKTLGTRMLADYAKMPQRRVAVASNRRILSFCRYTMLELPTSNDMGSDWPAREYAVETVRSLTATEESDSFIMKCPGMLQALALVAKGGPFAEERRCSSFVLHPSSDLYKHSPSYPTSSSARASLQNVKNRNTITSGAPVGLVSGKARLHACIALMNLSCGKANKIEIASLQEVLEAMRDVMRADVQEFVPPTSSPLLSSNNPANAAHICEEARLKAVACIKNLSNADANDTALLSTRGLVEALGYAAMKTCSEGTGATICTTNACLALMNLSIAKANKHEVFRTPGVMEALMTVLMRTSPRNTDGVDTKNPHNAEARIKACSALSNLAIGYDNKVPMFEYPGFVKSILHVIDTDESEARTKACSILWSFAAEMKNQVPVVQRGDILPTLVRIADEDQSTEARFKCVAALTLLAESLDNAMPLLRSGAIHPLMDILHEAGPDPTQWKGQTASWCVGFLMNIAQSDEAVPTLREAGVVELLAPLLSLDHYQSLKAAMAVTFVCRYDEDHATYDLLRKTENVIPKIINLLHNTLSGRGGNGYKYGVFTLRSSVGCIASLASGPEFMKERIAIRPVFENLLQVVSDFCVDGGTPGAIVGGGRDDVLSATFAVRALQSLTNHLVPIPGSNSLPFGTVMTLDLVKALDCFEKCSNQSVKSETRALAADAKRRINCLKADFAHFNTITDESSCSTVSSFTSRAPQYEKLEQKIAATLAQSCCGLPCFNGSINDAMILDEGASSVQQHTAEAPVRTFLLTDHRSGRRFVVPTDPCGGRAFNDNRLWCYRRGRYCKSGEAPDPDFQWTEDLEAQYTFQLRRNRPAESSRSSHNHDASFALEKDVSLGLGNSH